MICLLAYTHEDIKSKLEDLVTQDSLVGLNINNNTKNLRICSRVTYSISINCQEIEEINQFR